MADPEKVNAAIDRVLQQANSAGAPDTLKNTLKLALGVALAFVVAVDGHDPTRYKPTAKDWELLRVGAFEVWSRGVWAYKGWTLHMERDAVERVRVYARRVN